MKVAEVIIQLVIIQIEFLFLKSNAYTDWKTAPVTTTPYYHDEEYYDTDVSQDLVCAIEKWNIDKMMCKLYCLITHKTKRAACKRGKCVCEPFDRMNRYRPNFKGDLWCRFHRYGCLMRCLVKESVVSNECDVSNICHCNVQAYQGYDTWCYLGRRYCALRCLVLRKSIESECVDNKRCQCTHRDSHPDMLCRFKRFRLCNWWCVTKNFSWEATCGYNNKCVCGEIALDEIDLENRWPGHG